MEAAAATAVSIPLVPRDEGKQLEVLPTSPLT